ncbi:MAG: amidohydrolase family protein [Lachnospiraceae bacterium]|nr:amidohydrolase family protein [Lachnospiraceae bacterium]
MSSAAGLGFTLDTMTTLTAMITKGVFDDIPDLHVVTGHFGEALPFLLTRMDHFLTQEREAELKNTHDFSYYFKNNIWVTTSGNMQTSAFELTKDMLGIDRILLATDYPYESLQEEMDFLNGLDLTDEEREKLYHGNAEALMGIGE